MLKKRYLFLILIVCFFTISAVSAEYNSTSDIVSVSNDVNSLEANSNMNSIANDTNTLKASDDDILTAGNNWYVNSSKTSSGDGKTPETAFKTLQEAFDKASNGDTIMIASGEYIGNNNSLEISKKLNFIKYGDGEAIFDFQEFFGTIWIVTATSINITGLTFKNGKAAGGHGGAIYWSGANGTITNCNFINNTANAFGGAIFWKGANGTITNCNFTGNTAKYFGGAIDWSGANGTITNCNFINNTVNAFGGAICWSGVTNGTVSNCTFINNTSMSGTTNNYGGAIYWHAANGTVSNCTFINNTSMPSSGTTGIYGGAIYWYGANGTVSNCTFINNTAGSGGAIYWEGANGTVTNCTFTNNTSRDNGGAIDWHGANGTVSNCNFTNNTARRDNGGAIDWNGANGTVSNCTFTNNNANNFGGAIDWNGANGTVSNCTFINNTAKSNYYGGGAIFWYSGANGAVSNCTFINNTANVGGAIDWNSANGTVTNCTFTNNNANNFGGAINWDRSANGAVSNCTFINNTAHDESGAIDWNGANGTVTNCTFINNTANVGGAIDWNGANGAVTNCALVNNNAPTGSEIYINNDNLNLNYNWWGSNNPNWSKLIYGTYELSVYAVLNMTANPNEIYTSEKSNITAKFIWNGTNTDATNILPKRNIKLTSNGNLTETEGDVGLTSQFSATSGGIYYVNGTVDNEILGVNVKVNPLIPTNITVNTTFLDLTLDEIGTINATLNPPEAGNLTVNYDDKIITVTQNTDGIWYVTPKAEGNTTITFSFPGNEQYPPAESKNITVTVNRIHTEIDITNATVTLKVNDNVSSGATLTPPEAGNLTYNSSNTTVAVVENGIIKGLKEGTATITVSFAGNDEYAPAENKTMTITVKLRDASVSVNNDTLNLTVNDTFNLVATTNPAGLNVTYSSNNESVVTVDSNGKVTAKSTGTAIITASVGGDGVYALNSTNVSVTVNEKPIPPKENLTIEATAKPITVGEDANVIVTGLKDATGEVTVTVNGKTYTAPIKNSEAKVTIPDLTESVTGNVNYPGDKQYNPASTTVNITVNPKPKENLIISASAKPITVGENANVIVTGLKDATGEVTITIGSNKWTGKINQGTTNVVVTGLKESVIANVKFNGDDKYNPASTTVKITVNPNVIIDAPDVTKYYGGSERFAVTLKDLNGNPIANADIKITINGKTYTKTTDKNGETSMSINLNSGVYNVTTEYNGTKVRSTVTIKDTVIAKDVTKIYRNGTPYQGTFVDSKGNLVKNTVIEININGVFYKKTTDANGMAQMNINLPPRTYILTATNPSTNEQHTTTVKVLPNIVENYDLTKYYKNTSQYSLRLLDDKGNPVGAGVSIQLNINGVFYTRTSDANGYVKMNINLPPGTYIVTAEYKGLRMSNTIKVLTVLEAKDLVMKYHDGSQFKVKVLVKVLGGQGNPYAGQTVTYNINGVFYTKTTDGDGIAALTINLPAGEYIITSMYNGLNVANKVTIIG